MRSMSILHAVLLVSLIQHRDFKTGVRSERILCASHQYGSHLMILRAVADGMIKQGHEVYILLSDKTQTPTGIKEQGFKVLRYHSPDETRSLNYAGHADTLLNIALGRMPEDKPFVSRVAGNECYDLEADEQLMQQIDKIGFDLVLVEVFMLSSCLYFLPMRLDIPFITLTPQLEMDASRAPTLPSIVPFTILEWSDSMTFKQRLLNTVITIAVQIPALSPFPMVKDFALIKKYNHDPSVISWHDYARKSSLYVSLSGPVLGYPVPFLPHMITLECLLCGPGKPLPQTLSRMLDTANAAIVVSFGSGVRSVPEDIAVKFLQAFSRRTELVLWRFAGVLQEVVPDNVKVMEWLPQNDLLAHPKTKLFITHSGNNGQYESVYHGVPMLAFPLFGDQHFNAHRIFTHGYGLKADIKNFTVDELYAKIDAILNTPSFALKTQKAGKILKSQPWEPRDKMTYWIGHVLEFGTDHLRSHGLDMPWYAYFMVDVLLTISLVVLVLVMVIIIACVCMYKRCCKSKRNKVKVN